MIDRRRPGMENGRNGKKKEPVLVIIQLSGGNDFMNTLIPFTNGIYHDSRPLVGIPEDKALPINGELAFHPSASVLRDLYCGRQRRDRSGHRLRELKPVSFQVDGHLAHLRTERNCYGGLAGQGDPGDRPREQKPANGRQLRARPAPCNGRPRG